MSRYSYLVRDPRLQKLYLEYFRNNQYGGQLHSKRESSGVGNGKIGGSGDGDGDNKGDQGAAMTSKSCTNKEEEQRPAGGEEDNNNNSVDLWTPKPNKIIKRRNTIGAAVFEGMFIRNKTLLMKEKTVQRKSSAIGM